LASHGPFDVSRSSRIVDPSSLLLPDQLKGDDHPAVHELRHLSPRSEGQV